MAELRDRYGAVVKLNTSEIGSVVTATAKFPKLGHSIGVSGASFERLADNYAKTGDHGGAGSHYLAAAQEYAASGQMSKANKAMAKYKEHKVAWKADQAKKDGGNKGGGDSGSGGGGHCNQYGCT